LLEEGYAGVQEYDFHIPQRGIVLGLADVRGQPLSQLGQCRGRLLLLGEHVAGEQGG
jgi:hypothetical protein